MYWPPPVWWQWMASTFCPNRRVAAAAADTDAVV